MKNLLTELRISLVATLSLAVILCGIYPMIMWVLSQGLFSHKANGSLVISKGTVIGSSLLGQGFTDPKYFHSRPSAAGEGYDATHSGGTNWGPLSKKLIHTVSGRVTAYRVENDLPPVTPVPVDGVTASASGLDPHISVKNALLQARRVARARDLSLEVVMKKIGTHTEGRTLRVLGEPRVNVLMLNLDLDGRL
ncbi:MAG: potassium-transporting ATPase subunit C [Deltaproteobacteria bacterium RBG_13_47_9]|nr:MAG: potassium-transporting ATPase subunit C [Deltaproteobacteria bacterium RBG_13_47_9]